jgi:hypothetical protein
MAAAPAEPDGTSIEALFRPSTRWRDSHRGFLPEGWTEIELLPGLELENILATGVTWDEFLIFLRHKMVWMTPDVYVCPMYLAHIGDQQFLCIGAYGRNRLCVRVTPDMAAAVATATCDFVLRLFATTEERDLFIEGYTVSTSLSGAGLSLFFQESRSCLRKVTLHGTTLNEDQCRALATMSRLDVELKISNCYLAEDAAGAFVECLKSDRGPVKLSFCVIDSQILANALAGDSRVTELRLYRRETNNADMAILFRALANNRGLEDFYLYGCAISNDNWSVLCESLQAHPTLANLDLRATRPMSPADDIRITLSAEQKAHRTRLIAEMMKENKGLHTIHFCASERVDKIYTEAIRPYLVTNQYRPRVNAIKKTKDRPFREKVLGRALYSVRSKPNLVWMLVSENVDAFVRSEEEEEESNSEVPVVVAAAVVVEVAGSKRKR